MEQVLPNLIVLRSLAGFTQMELSRRSGVGVRQIQKVENGESKLENITLGTARKLAAALQVSTDDLQEIRRA